ncbi:hypothetical protein ACFFPL_03075, partial [Paeniglutamicibacter sulfureus]
MSITITFGAPRGARTGGFQAGTESLAFSETSPVKEPYPRTGKGPEFIWADIVGLLFRWISWDNVPAPR